MCIGQSLIYFSTDMSSQAKRIITVLDNDELCITLFIPYFWTPAQCFIVCMPIYITHLQDLVEERHLKQTHISEKHFRIAADGVYMSIKLPALAFRVYRYHFVFECPDQKCQTIYDLTDDKYVQEMFCICRFLK